MPDVCVREPADDGRAAGQGLLAVGRHGQQPAGVDTEEAQRLGLPTPRTVADPRQPGELGVAAAAPGRRGCGRRGWWCSPRRRRSRPPRPARSRVVAHRAEPVARRRQRPAPAVRDLGLGGGREQLDQRPLQLGEDRRLPVVRRLDARDGSGRAPRGRRTRSGRRPCAGRRSAGAVRRSSSRGRASRPRPRMPAAAALWRSSASRPAARRGAGRQLAVHASVARMTCLACSTPVARCTRPGPYERRGSSRGADARCCRRRRGPGRASPAGWRRSAGSTGRPECRWRRAVAPRLGRRELVVAGAPRLLVLDVGLQPGQLGRGRAR